MNHHYKTGILATYDFRPLYAVYNKIVRFGYIANLRTLYPYTPEQMADFNNILNERKVILSGDRLILKVGTSEKS